MRAVRGCYCVIDSSPQPVHICAHPRALDVIPVSCCNAPAAPVSGRFADCIKLRDIDGVCAPTRQDE